MRTGTSSIMSSWMPLWNTFSPKRTNWNKRDWLLQAANPSDRSQPRPEKDHASVSSWKASAESKADDTFRYALRCLRKRIVYRFGRGVRAVDRGRD